MTHDVRTAVEQCLAAHDVTQFSFETASGGHIKLTASAGEYQALVYFDESGDWRASRNTVCAVRRALNLRREKRPPVPRRTRCAVKRSHAPFIMKSAPATPPTKLSWQETLAAHCAGARPAVPTTH